MHKKRRSTIMLSEDIFKNTRIYAIKKGMDISSFIEEALIEKIAKTQEIERKQQELTELTATVNVAKKLYQQLKQKSDFNSGVSADFIKTIISGIDPKYHDYVAKAIIEEEDQTYQQIQPQLQIQAQSQPLDFLDSSNLEITGSAHNEVHVKLYLPDIQFPTNRDRLLEHARNIERNKELFILNELPNTNKVYGNKKELEENILKSFTVSKKLVSELKRYKVDKIIGCTVTTTKYKNELLNSEVTYKGRIK